MAENEETATARYIAGNVSTQLMLKTLFEIIATMADDPDIYRSDMRRKLLELADDMPLAPMSARHLVWQRHRRMPPKLRAFIDFVAEAC
jgi:DNA-binding transcriptional LysR family regulator